MHQSLRKRGIGYLARALLSVFALLLQGALPVLHELEVAAGNSRTCRTELHESASAGPYLLPVGTAEAHDAHHHGSSCAICRTLSHARQLSAFAALHVSLPPAAATAGGPPRNAPASSLPAAPSGPRAPPIVLS